VVVLDESVDPEAYAVRDTSMSADEPLRRDGVGKIVIAHHPRLCHGCQETIPVGHRYRRWQTFADLKVWHECATCAGSNDRPIPETDR
jgi:hypothetical protein